MAGRVIGEPAVVGAAQAATEDPLTAREHEVLGLLAEGLPNKQIARQLGISEHTVKFHVSSVFAKLGAQSRAEAVSIGARNGLISL
jgi:DNA-binding CsgD family transcriptional regulator